MRSELPGRYLLACLCLNLATAGATSTQAPPIFPTGVELITVDVVVADRNGLPVPGLTSNDFVLREDGAVQGIVGFQAFDRRRARAREAEEVPVWATNKPASGTTARAFAIVVDDLAMTAPEAVTARRVIASFLEDAVAADDLVTLLSASGELWWSAQLPEGLEDLQAVAARLQGHDPVLSQSGDDMSEYEERWIAEHREGGVSAGKLTDAANEGREVGVGSPLERVLARWLESGYCPTIGGKALPSCVFQIRARAEALDTQRAARTRALLEAVRGGVQALADVKGRKSLLLLSPGFLQDSRANARSVEMAAREASVAVYFVDVRGLLAATGLRSAADTASAVAIRSVGAVSMETQYIESAGARTLADETGGFSVSNTNDLAAGVERISLESDTYYLLAFRAPAGKPVDRWRKLHVEVKRPGLTVRARRGYTVRRAAHQPTISAAEAEEPGSRTLLPQKVESALGSSHEVTGIPLRSITYVRDSVRRNLVRVMVVSEFDASGLAYAPSGDRRSAHVVVTIAITPRDTGRTTYVNQRAEVQARREDPAGWRALAQEVMVPPGVAQARVVVRDAVGEALGAVSRRFEVPQPDSLYLATPILTDETNRGEDGHDRPRATFGANRLFRTDRPLYCEFEVFGAARDPSDGTPRVSAELAIIGASGTLVRQAPATRIRAAAGSRIVRLVGLDIHDFVAGEYQLLLRVHDEVGGGVVQHRESFAVVR